MLKKFYFDILIRKRKIILTEEQFALFIQKISELGSGSEIGHGFMLFNTTLGAVIAGLVAYGVARYQIKNSEAQQRERKEDEIRNQRMFMIQQLKLKYTEQLLEHFTKVESSILDVIDLGIEKHKHYLRNQSNYDRESEKIAEFDRLVQNKIDEYKVYLNNLHTLMKLFDVDAGKIDIKNMEEIGDKLLTRATDVDFYKTLIVEEELLYEVSIWGVGQEVLDKLRANDIFVRDLQIELINSIRQTSKEKE